MLPAIQIPIIKWSGDTFGPGLIEDYIDQDLNQISFERLIKDGIPKEMLDSVPEKGILDIIDDRSLGYLLRIGDTFHLMEGDYSEVFPAVLFPLFLEHGMSYFINSQARFLAIPVGTIVDGKPITQPLLMSIHTTGEEDERVHVVGGRTLTTLIVEPMDWVEELKREPNSGGWRLIS